MCDRLIPHCTLMTPNLPEAEILSGIPIRDIEDMANAGRHILTYGCRSVLIKGGHLDGGDMTDILVCVREFFQEKKASGRHSPLPLRQNKLR